MATQYNISPDEKMTAVMAYTRDGMYWGNLVTPKDMKVSGLLQRSQMLPEYLVFREANSLILSSRNPQPIENPEFFIPIDSIIAFHVMPSVREESAYYDANQHNLTLKSVIVFVGAFQMRGVIPLTGRADLKRYLDTTKSLFISVHQVEITHPYMPEPGAVSVEYVTVRKSISIVSEWD